MALTCREVIRQVNSRYGCHVELVVVNDGDTTCTVIATLRVVRVVVGWRLSKRVIDSLSHVCAMTVSKYA